MHMFHLITLEVMIASKFRYHNPPSEAVRLTVPSRPSSFVALAAVHKLSIGDRLEECQRSPPYEELFVCTCIRTVQFW